MPTTISHFLLGAPLLADAISGGMLALGVAMLLVILFRRSGRYYRKLKKQIKKKKPTAFQAKRQDQMDHMFERSSPLLDAPATVVRWQVEMHDLARDLNAEIDTKMRALQVLVKQSNAAADRLEAAAARAEQLSTSAERLGISEQLDDSEPASILELAAQAAQERTVTSPTPPHSAEIQALAEAGENVATIASRVGLPVGDVEFVLSLQSPTDPPPAF